MTGAQDSDLHRLTYLSSSCDAMPADELDAILDSSRRNNSRHGITGLLMYHDMQFFQTLEGSRHELEELYARIVRDRRHSQCLRLEFRPVADRYFADWSMAYRSFGEFAPADKQNFLDLTRLGRRYRGGEESGDLRTGILIGSFLSGLRDLDFA